MKNQTLSYEDFFSEVWGNVSYEEISEQSYWINQEKFREFLFGLHRLGVDFNQASRILVLAYKTGLIS